MKAQLKHSILMQWKYRAFTIGAIVAVNLFFFISGLLLDDSKPQSVTFAETGMVISGFMILAYLIVVIIATYMGYENVFKVPNCYLSLLTPVKRWKIMFSRIFANVAFDIAGLVIGFVGTFIQTLTFDRISQSVFSNFLERQAQVIYESDAIVVYHEPAVISEEFVMLSGFALAAVIGYFAIVAFMYFVSAMNNSIFASLRHGQLRSILSSLVVLWALWLVDFALLIPAFNVEVEPLPHAVGLIEYLPIYIVTIPFGMNFATIFYFVTVALRALALFIGAAYLLERRINV